METCRAFLLISFRRRYATTLKHTTSPSLTPRVNALQKPTSWYTGLRLCVRMCRSRRPVSLASTVPKTCVHRPQTQHVNEVKGRKAMLECNERLSRLLPASPCLSSFHPSPLPALPDCIPSPSSPPPRPHGSAWGAYTLDACHRWYYVGWGEWGR